MMKPPTAVAGEVDAPDSSTLPTSDYEDDGVLVGKEDFDLEDDLPDFSELAGEDQLTLAQRDRARKIASLLTFKKGDDANAPSMHPLSEQRVLFEGILSKRGTKSLMKRTAARHVFLFSESILITTLSGNKFVVHNRLPLNCITLLDTVNLDGALPHSFCVVAPERSFELKASDAETKCVWLRHLQDALWTELLTNNPIRASVKGWKHQLLGGTPWAAALEGHVSTLRSMFRNEKGNGASPADVNAKDDEGATALHYAALRNHASSVEWLLECGADPDAVDSALATPLHYAALRSSVASAETLLRNGARHDIEDLDGDVPLITVVRRGSLGGCEACARARDFIHCLGVNGANPQATDAHGNSALHVAVPLGAELLVGALLRIGAKTDSQCPITGRTPLHAACALKEHTHLGVIALLLQWGASPNAPDLHSGSKCILVI